MSPAKKLSTEERLDRLEAVLRGAGFHEPKCAYLRRPEPGDPPPESPAGRCDCWLSESR